MTNFPLDELLEWQPRLQLGRVNHQELTVDQGYGAGIGVSSQGIPTNEQLSQATRLELESRKVRAWYVKLRGWNWSISRYLKLRGGYLKLRERNWGVSRYLKLRSNYLKLRSWNWISRYLKLGSYYLKEHRLNWISIARYLMLHGWYL